MTFWLIIAVFALGYVLWRTGYATGARDARRQAAKGART